MIVLIIGYGSIAKKHKAALDSLYPDARVFALRSGTKAGSAEIEGVQSIFDPEEIPADTDFAIISSPTFRHTESIRMLAERNIPLFIEKPLAHTLEGLEDIASLIREKKLFSYVACNLRFLPALQFLHDTLAARQKRVNEVNVYAGSYLPDWRPHLDYKTNYSAHENMGGGVHLDLFHELDYVCWLFGMPEYSNSICRSKSSLGINAIDFASYSLVYDTFVATVQLNYYRRVAKRTLEVVFEDCCWTVDIINNRITDDKNVVVFDGGDFRIIDTYKVQMKWFIDALRSNSPFNTFEESLRILKISLQEHETKR